MVVYDKSGKAQQHTKYTFSEYTQGDRPADIVDKTLLCAFLEYRTDHE